MIPHKSYLLFKHICTIYLCRWAFTRNQKLLLIVMSNPFHHSSTAEAETGITGIKDCMVSSNPFHHSSTAKAGTGITGIKDDATRIENLFVYKIKYVSIYYVGINLPYRPIPSTIVQPLKAETRITGIKDYHWCTQSLPPQFNCQSRNRNNRDQRWYHTNYNRLSVV